MRRLPPLLLIVTFLLGSPFPLHAAGETSAEARRQLDGLREIQVVKGDAKIDALNKKMDAVWSYMKAHPEGLTTVTEELGKAVAAPKADQFFLLDMSYLSIESLGAKALDLATSALAKIDPASAIMQANKEELFHLVMKMGALGASEKYLLQLDRIYLGREESLDFFRAPHLVKLGPWELRCMVYGVAGDPAADHLAGLLKTSKLMAEIVQVLSAIGSETNVPEVKAVLESTGAYKTISACVSFMMQVGGPLGKTTVLAADPSKFDAASKAYFGKIKPGVEAVDFKALVAQLATLDPKAANDESLQKLLDKMEANNGADNETPPAAVARSGIPTVQLLAQVKRIRARGFRRETNHALEDLPVTNMLLNALQFKPKK